MYSYFYLNLWCNDFYLKINIWITGYKNITLKDLKNPQGDKMIYLHMDCCINPYIIYIRSVILGKVGLWFR